MTTDIIDALTGITPGDALDAARARRPEARAHAQGSFEALFRPIDASQASLAERAAVALFVARLHGQTAAVEFYGALLRETGGGVGLEPLIVAEAARVSGGEYRVDSVEAAYALGDRLAAALEHAHFLVMHPRDASRERLGALLADGWSTTGVVTLSQLVSFLTFQLRVIHGLSVLREHRGADVPAAGAHALGALAASVARSAAARLGDAADAAPAAATEELPTAPQVTVPPAFTADSLGWKPWLTPLPAAEFTELQHRALVEPERIHMPYFRLLARDPEALLERTLTDMDIFYNTDAGLPRADRELAAAAASRFNGCVFCASVHARFSIEQGADPDQVQRLLDEGVTVRTTPRWDALIDATVALTRTPSEFATNHVATLRELGLAELELLDVIQAGAFFNWANRLMLSLGEPHVASRS